MRTLILMLDDDNEYRRVQIYFAFMVNIRRSKNKIKEKE
jgi:hypothetical protein